MRMIASFVLSAVIPLSSVASPKHPRNSRHLATPGK
jgi:hypothetical protein